MFVAYCLAWKICVIFGTNIREEYWYHQVSFGIKKALQYPFLYNTGIDKVSGGI
jgi:hypothetical protein